jgi:hypothetical protein
MFGRTTVYSTEQYCFVLKADIKKIPFSGIVMKCCVGCTVAKSIENQDLLLTF